MMTRPQPHERRRRVDDYKRFDFFTRQLLGVNPPDGRDVERPRKTDSANQR